MHASPKVTFPHDPQLYDPNNLDTFQSKFMYHVTMIAMMAQERLLHRGLLLIDVAIRAHNNTEDDLGVQRTYQGWEPRMVHQIFQDEGFAVTRVFIQRMCRSQLAFRRPEDLLDVLHFCEELGEKVHPGTNAVGERELTLTEFRKRNILFVSELEQIRLNDPAQLAPTPDTPEEAPESDTSLRRRKKYDYSRLPKNYQIQKFQSRKAADAITTIRVRPATQEEEQ